MQYIKLATKEFPLHEGDIRLEHPEIGETFVCPDTYAVVLPAMPPAIDTTKYRYADVVAVFEYGVWRAKFNVVEKTQQELRLAFIDADTEENRKIADLENMVKAKIADKEFLDYAAWAAFGEELKAFKYAYPRPETMPSPPAPLKFDRDGNVLTTEMPGGVPNAVI